MLLTEEKIMLLMVTVVALYTVCSLSDKYAVSKAKYNGAQLTFLMAAGTVPFLLMTLPFSDRTLTFTFQALAAVLGIALSKYLEFDMSAKILVEMSLFELKAWLGLTLFMSYFTDLIMGVETLNALRLVCIAVTAGGLVMIAVTGGHKVNYKAIAIPLVLYIASRFMYGFVMTAASEYISSTMTLLFALIVLALVMIPAAKPLSIAKNSPEGKKGVFIVLLCKLPNALGLLGENAIAAASLTDFAFIQPMILVVIFVIGFFKKETRPSGLNLVGSVLCTAGILGFQAVGAFM